MMHLNSGFDCLKSIVMWKGYCNKVLDEYIISFMESCLIRKGGINNDE